MKMHNGKKFLLVQTAIGDYRQLVMERIVNELRSDFLALSGAEYFNSSTITNINIGDSLSIVKNNFFFQRKILWQSNVISRAVTADSVILEFNPRIISNWIVVILRKLIGKKTVFWGHAWGRLGQKSRTAIVRRVFRSFCDVLVVYTLSQKREVEDEGVYKGVVVSAPNALYTKNEMKPIPSLVERNNIIYVGRLVEEKCPDRLLIAFSNISSKIPKASLVFIGDGPMMMKLKKMASDLGVESKVSFRGHVANIEDLYNEYSLSFCSVSPGYVGLSITQSLGFGVPMVISKNENHAPEIEAAVENENCLFFLNDVPGDFEEKLLLMYEHRDYWKSKSYKISEKCSDLYSVEVMANKIIEAFVYGEK